MNYGGEKDLENTGAGVQNRLLIDTKVGDGNENGRVGEWSQEIFTYETDTIRHGSGKVQTGVKPCVMKNIKTNDPAAGDVQTSTTHGPRNANFLRNPGKTTFQKLLDKNTLVGIKKNQKNVRLRRADPVTDNCGVIRLRDWDSSDCSPNPKRVKLVIQEEGELSSLRVEVKPCVVCDCKKDDKVEKKEKSKRENQGRLKTLIPLAENLTNRKAANSAVIADLARKIMNLEIEDKKPQTKVKDLESTAATLEHLLQKALNPKDYTNIYEGPKILAVDIPKQAMGDYIGSRAQYSPLHVPVATNGPVTVPRTVLPTSGNNNVLHSDSFDGFAVHSASFPGVQVLDFDSPLTCEIPPNQLSKALFDAVCERNLDEVLLLLKIQTSVNRPYERSSPLHEAAGRGYAEIVSVLISYGAYLSAQDKFGDTPLHLAAFNGFEICVEKLLDAGALINVARFDGSTPLHRAAEGGACECVRSLLNAGADPIIFNDKDDLPEDLARTDEIRYLLLNKC